ncbi:hypothetical protein [Nitrobacter sp.]|uniref:hypothetical protein n=1 Tax=Nitrobacter sp. TaxID=29420 RepID=UPI003F654775
MTAGALFTGLRERIDSPGMPVGWRFLLGYLSRAYRRIHLQKTRAADACAMTRASIRTSHRGITAKSDDPDHFDITLERSNRCHLDLQ